jgi:mannitol/fructose-specific phosphotransferase system IIA component (Ntr-type)/biotin operon repressor
VRDSRAELPVGPLLREFSISERTLRADISEINEFLRGLHMAGLYVNVAGRLQASEDFSSATVLAALDNVNVQSYRFSKRERKFYIELLLLWGDRYYSMQDIADELNVSRVTVMKDIDDLRDPMGEEGVAVNSEAGKGVRTCCPADLRIDLLVKRLRGLALENGNKAIYQRIVIERLAPSRSFEDIYVHARDYLESNGIVVTDEAFYDVILCLFILLNAPFDVSGTAAHEGEFSRLDGLLAYVCGRLGICVDRDRLVAFANFLERNNIGSYVRSLDEIEFYEVVIHFLLNIDRTLGTSLAGDGVLANALLLHLKSMRDWIDLDFDFTEEDAAPIDYYTLEKAVRSNIGILQKYLNYEINDSMVKSIMLHICVSLIKGVSSNEKPFVAIVCPGSMATGRYLEAQIKSYFDFNIVGVFPEQGFEEQLGNTAKPDLVISTVPLSGTSYPNVTVHPVLDMDDLKAIKKATTALGGASELSKVSPVRSSDDKMDALASYLHGADLPDELRMRLVQEVRNYQSSERRRQPTRIGELLKPNCFEIDDENMTWDEGIRRAGDMLVADGSIEPRFVEKAIETVRKYGDYIVLSPGVALAHASADSGVLRDGLSLLVSHRGIPFSNPENVVNFLFCFASQGVSEYTYLFSEIISIGQDAGRRAQLLGMDAADLFDALCWQVR